MPLGLIGRKCGMTRLFQEDGTSVPVTVILLEPNRVVQHKTNANDAYSALQMTTGVPYRSRVNKAIRGHYAKAEVAMGRRLRESRVCEKTLEKYPLGAELTVETFSVGEKVDVTGTTKGKGFAGTVKRHHFRTQDATHGNSVSHRVPGSIGQRQTPGRVFKGKRMPGHMGDVRRTVQNLEVVRIDPERHLLWVKGAVPGCPNADVLVRASLSRYAGKKVKEG